MTGIGMKDLICTICSAGVVPLYCSNWLIYFAGCAAPYVAREWCPIKFARALQMFTQDVIYFLQVCLNKNVEGE